MSLQFLYGLFLLLLYCLFRYNWFITCYAAFSGKPRLGLTLLSFFNRLRCTRWASPPLLKPTSGISSLSSLLPSRRFNSLFILFLLPDEYLFDLANVFQYQVEAVEVDTCTGSCQEIAQCWQLLLVYCKDSIDCTLSDMQRWGVWQKIVAHKEAKEHKVVQQTLEIKSEWQLYVLELQVQILSDHI